MFIKIYSKNNQTYGASVSPAVKVFRGSMDKNTLISDAIYRTLCMYKNLRVCSGYPSVLGKYSIEKRESVCPSNGFCKTSVRTYFFINYSDRVKYKGKRSFSSKSRESKDLRFSRKFCRKTAIDVRSEVISWIEQNSQIVKFMWTLYNNPKTKHLIFENRNINKIRKLFTDYNFIQSLLVIDNLSKLKTRIIQRNIPHEIERLQCIFLESFPISVLAVYEISKSSGANTPGVDRKFFKTLNDKRNEFREEMLKGSRYQKSGKTFKVKKDLPLKARITDEVLKQLKLELEEETLKFRFKLLQQCNFKTLRKSYKGSAIQRVWIQKKTLGDFRPLGIPTLRDRVLQQIVTWAIQPICESQTDSLSFGFRPQRSAIQAIAYIYRKLSKSRISRKRSRFKPVKVGKEQFESFVGKKAKFKSSKISGIKERKRNRKYNYNYWIYPEKKSNFVNFKFHSQYYYLNVDVKKCFDKILHQVIFEKIPLTNKYSYLIKHWAACPIIGPETKGGKDIKFKPTEGVPQGSIIGPMISNIVLDGLQDFIQDNLPVRYKRSKEELDYMKYKRGEKPSSSNSHTYLQVFCVRYADDILILGKCLKSHVKQIQSLLITFLSQRGLEIKNACAFQGKRFKPGTFFNYLGFTFKFPNLDSASFDKGKYTKLEFNPMSVADGIFSRYSRSGPYLLIQSSSLKKLKDSLRVQLSKKNAHLPVKTMIDKVNTVLRGTLNYYNFTMTTQKQLLSINNLLHKLFYKYLFRKFSSVPKIYSFIKTKFIDQNRFKDENKISLRITDVKPLESVTLVFMASSNKF